MKKKLTFLSRLSGIVLGVALTFFMAVFAMKSVFTNNDFWLKQNDRYKHQETLSLVSSDDYAVLYENYILAYKEGKNESFTVTKKGDPQNFTDTFKKLGSVHPSTSEIEVEKSVSVDGKFLETLKQIEEAKYQKIDFANKTYYEFSCPYATNNFSGVNIKDLKITDASGMNVEFTLKSVSVLKDGSIKTEKVDVSDGNILFKPQSKTTVLRAYIASGNVEKTNVSFKVSGVDGSVAVNLLYSYEDSLTKEGVASLIGPEEDIVSAEEKLQLSSAGIICARLKAASFVLVAAAVLFAGFVIKTEKRESLLGIGFYTFLTALILIVAIDLLVYFVPSEWGFNLVFDFYENSTSAILIGNGFMRDFAEGAARFFSFINLATVFIGYVLTKISKPNKTDPNEDYLYQ